MTPHNHDPLKEFLDRHELTPPAAPHNEFAMIESRLFSKRPSIFWLWVTGATMAASVIAAIFIQVGSQSSQISDEELAQFFTESYELDEDGDVVGEHFLSLVDR